MFYYLSHFPFRFCGAPAAPAHTLCLCLIYFCFVLFPLVHLITSTTNSKHQRQIEETEAKKKIILSRLNSLLLLYPSLPPPRENVYFVLTIFSQKMLSIFVRQMFIRIVEDEKGEKMCASSLGRLCLCFSCVCRLFSLFPSLISSKIFTAPASQ